MKKIAFTLVILLLSACTQRVRADDFSLDSYLKASSEQPYDVGFWLQNASCTQNYGWSRNSNDAAANYNTHNSEFDNSLYRGTCIESWYFAPVKNSDLIWQEISDILPGTYVDTAYAVGQVYNDAANKGRCLSGLHFRANDSSVPITQPQWQQISVTCKVKQGETLTIAIAADGQNPNDWTGIANVRIACVGAGTAEDIALSEDYDVTCVRGVTFANVQLKRSIPSDCLSAICLPFDVDTTTGSGYFSEIWAVSGATPHGNDYVLQLEATDRICRGHVYLVKAKDGSIPLYVFDNVLVNTTVAEPKIAVGDRTLQGHYRKTLTTQPVWMLQDDGKTMHRTDAPTIEKGFCASIK